MIAGVMKKEGPQHRNWADMLIMAGMIVNGIVILLLFYYYFFVK